MSCLVNNRLSSIFSQMIELGCLFYLVNFFILFIYLKINVGKWAIGNAISIVTLTISLCPLPRWSEIFEGNPSVSSTLLTWNAENKKEKLLYCPMMLQVLKQTVVWFYCMHSKSPAMKTRGRLSKHLSISHRLAWATEKKLENCQAGIYTEGLEAEVLKGVMRQQLLPTGRLGDKSLKQKWKGKQKSSQKENSSKVQHWLHNENSEA